MPEARAFLLRPAWALAQDLQAREGRRLAAIGVLRTHVERYAPELLPAPQRKKGAATPRWWQIIGLGRGRRTATTP